MTPLILTAVTLAPVGLGLFALVRFKLRKPKIMAAVTTVHDNVNGEWRLSSFSISPLPGWETNPFYLAHSEKMNRIYSIVMRRNALKDEIARLKRNKKRHSHRLAELQALTREELALEGMK